MTNDKKPPIEDLRSDPTSTAESHVIHDGKGAMRIESRPPASVADAQARAKGYDPTKMFDEENAAKAVPGVHRPQPSSTISTSPAFAKRIEAAKARYRATKEQDNTCKRNREQEQD